MNSIAWFSVDATAHLRKLSRFHHHMPAGFVLDLIRFALKRGASRVMVTLESDSIQLDDDAPPIEENRIKSLFDLTRSELQDATRERIIHDLIDPPGLGVISVFTPAPESIRFHVRRNQNESTRFDWKPGNGIRKSFDWFPVASANNRISICNARHNFLTYLPAIRSACVKAGAVIEVNGTPIEKGSLLRNVILSRHFRWPPFPGTMEIALPESGENCRFILTDHGIPWDEISLPPVQGYVFDLQIETAHPQEDHFPAQWIPVARQLYAIAAREFTSWKQEHKQRMEELFFLYHKITGRTILFQDVPLFQSSIGNQYLSLLQAKEKSKKSPLPFRFFHQPSALSVREKENYLLLSTRQVDFLARVGIPVRQIHDPIPGIPPLFLRMRRLLRKLQVISSRVFFSRRTRVNFTEMTQREKAFFIRLLGRLSASNRSSQKSGAPWILVVLDCRGILPVWPGPRLAGYKLKEMSLARHHPDILEAMRHYEKDSETMEMIAARFRPFLSL